MLGPGPRLVEKRIYRAAVSQRLRNTGVDDSVRYGWRGGVDIRRRYRFVVSMHGEILLVAKSLVFVREIRTLLAAELPDGIFSSLLRIKKCVLTVTFM